MKSAAIESYNFNMVRSGRELEQYYSVEIPVAGLHTVYQFGIWEIEYLSLSILISEYSELLNWIKEGDRLKMRFYSNDPGNPYQYLDSELIFIERQDSGRLRGHYLAGIEILEEQRDSLTFWPYKPSDFHLIPFNMWPADYTGL